MEETINYIEDLYTKLDNIKHSLAMCEKVLMLSIKRMIGTQGEFELETPIKMEIPERGVVDVCKVKYANEDTLWLSWKDPKVIPSGYRSIQSWMLDRVEGNRKVCYLAEIDKQIRDMQTALGDEVKKRNDERYSKK